MKLYKFRALSNCDDFSRIKEIIETGEFWCSKFMDMNDPMEGVYLSAELNKKEIAKIYDEKESYKICSFSGENGFKNPLMWGYYANGFKGIAIEIEIEESDNQQDKIVPINYETKKDERGNIIDILTYKRKCWEHENEYRFLDKEIGNRVKIGKITKVYFGHPYNNVNNQEIIMNNNKKLQKYLWMKKELEEFLDSKDIDFEDVTIEISELK